MDIVFEARASEATALRPLVVDRLRFAMRRLTWLVPRARVMLSDANGPRGGIDKRCQIEIRTRNAETLVITTLARDWRTALDTSLARATQALIRTWRRSRQHKRVRIQVPQGDH